MDRFCPGSQAGQIDGSSHALVDAQPEHVGSRVVRHELWQTIRALRQREEVSVLLSTHYLEEVEAVCDRVAVIDHGRIIALDRPANLIDEVGRLVPSATAAARDVR